MKRIVSSRAAASVAASMVISVLVATGGAAATAPAGDPPATAKWAWATVRRSAETYTPAAKDQGNSEGGNNTVTSEGNGRYSVLLRDVGGGSGVILISTFGAQRRSCVPTGFFASGSDPADEFISLRCFAMNGDPANARFVLNWLAAEGVGGRLAYGWVNSPSLDGCHSPAFPYHSQGGSIQDCPEPPLSVVQIADLGSGRGIAHVSPTSLHDGSGSTSPAVCDVDSSFESTPDEHVATRCYDADGEPQLGRWYFFAFMQGLGMKGVERDRVAYVLANQPTTASYAPDPDHSYSSAGGANHVTRQGTGRYTVILPGMPLGGSAQVTPVGSAERQCSVARIAKSGTQQRVSVRCWDLDGDPRNAVFALSYAR